jgi:hypothetical protein
MIKNRPKQDQPDAGTGPLAVVQEQHYDPLGLSLETLFDTTYNTTFGPFNSPNPQRHSYKQAMRRYFLRTSVLRLIAA